MFFPENFYFLLSLKFSNSPYSLIHQTLTLYDYQQSADKLAPKRHRRGDSGDQDECELMMLIFASGDVAAFCLL